MLKRLSLSVVLVFSTGCAAIFGSSQKPFDFTTEPPGADVYIDGQRMGVTPFTVILSNNDPVTVTFKKEGYAEVTCMLQPKTGAGWVVGDALLLVFYIIPGLVAFAVDAGTGSWSQIPVDGCHRVLPESST